MPLLHRLSLLAAMIAVLPFISAASEPPAKPSQEQIAQWVRQLVDDDFSKREEASKKLYEAGEAAEAALREATRSDNAEVAHRAIEIMDKFKWGLYPEAPKEIVELVKRYRESTPPGKTEVIRELLNAPTPTQRVLLKIILAEEDSTTRSNIFQLIRNELSLKASQWIADENYDAVEPLIGLLVAADVERGAGYEAAYWLLRGKLDEHITHLKTMTGNGPEGKRLWEIVAHLYRAKGDLAAARIAAEKADKPDLVDDLMLEAGDWPELAKRQTHNATGNATEGLGFRAAYCRLSGDMKGFETALDDLGATSLDEEASSYLAKVLFLNDRPDDAIKRLHLDPRQPVMLFDVLIAQMKYKEAISSADGAKASDLLIWPQLEIMKARTLYLLGEKEKAAAIFARWGGQIKGKPDLFWYGTLIDSENRVGLKEQAAEHAAIALSVTRDTVSAAQWFPKLFPKNAEAAETLWSILWESRRQTPEATMKNVRALLDGTANPKFVSDLAQGPTLTASIFDPLEAPRRLRGAAEAALGCKDEKLARSLLEKAEKLGSPEALIRLGDLDAEKKEWDKAAERYNLAWKKAPANPLPYYLSGWVLTQAGQEKEGKKRMEQAHWMPLGDDQVRSAFLRNLSERGQNEAVWREGELLMRFSAPGSVAAANGMRLVAIAAMNHKEYLPAAQWMERSMLCCLKVGVTYPQPVLYLGVPALVHRLRAKGYTVAGDFDAAQREVDLCLTALPGDSFVPIELVPMWEKAGRKKEATELFERCLSVQQKLCDAYPNSTAGHNGAAWLSVCCRRNLESAYKHALRAVELAPSDAGILDTLGEVEFQLGNKDKAIAAQKKAVALEPKRVYFRKQLKRIEAGDSAAERPSENDEE